MPMATYQSISRQSRRRRATPNSSDRPTTKRSAPHRIMSADNEASTWPDPPKYYLEKRRRPPPPPDGEFEMFGIKRRQVETGIPEAPPLEEQVHTASTEAEALAELQRLNTATLAKFRELLRTMQETPTQCGAKGERRERRCLVRQSSSLFLYFALSLSRALLFCSRSHQHHCVVSPQLRRSARSSSTFSTCSTCSVRTKRARSSLAWWRVRLRRRGG